MKQLNFVLIACFGFSFTSFSQQTAQQVIAAGGGTARGGGVKLDWTLGEVATTSLYTSDALYTQGFHQPLLVIEKLTFSRDLPVNDARISIFPNPVTSVLLIQLHFLPEAPLTLTLLDGFGKQVIRKQIPAKTARLQVNVAGLAQGAYFLQIQNEDGSINRNFNVIKTQ